MLLAPETKVTVTEAPARARHSTSDLFLLTCLPKTTPTVGIDFLLQRQRTDDYYEYYT